MRFTFKTVFASSRLAKKAPAEMKSSTRGTPKAQNEPEYQGITRHVKLEKSSHIKQLKFGFFKGNMKGLKTFFSKIATRCLKLGVLII